LACRSDADGDRRAARAFLIERGKFSTGFYKPAQQIAGPGFR
jgi:hypothetical protein